jgi:CTP:molybdopterin cytidylyltransferase MocA
MNMVDVVILISGSSKRMMQEKALLPFFKTKNFVCQLVETYLKFQNAHVFVVVNPNNELRIKESCEKYKNKIQFVVNSEAEKGRHWSILTALKRIELGRGVFIQNIDNPFTSEELISEMLRNYQPNSFLVPQFEGKNGHPLLLGAHLVDEMKMNAEKITDLKGYLNNREKRSLKTKDKTILANINNPEEYKKWFPLSKII